MRTSKRWERGSEAERPRAPALAELGRRLREPARPARCGSARSPRSCSSGASSLSSQSSDMSRTPWSPTARTPGDAACAAAMCMLAAFSVVSESSSRGDARLSSRPRASSSRSRTTDGTCSTSPAWPGGGRAPRRQHTPVARHRQARDRARTSSRWTAAPDDGQDATGVATDRNGERVYLSIQNLRHNMETIDNCRTPLTLFAGGMTGVLGCTGLQVRRFGHARGPLSPSLSVGAAARAFVELTRALSSPSLVARARARRAPPLSHHIRAHLSSPCRQDASGCFSGTPTWRCRNSRLARCSRAAPSRSSCSGRSRNTRRAPSSWSFSSADIRVLARRRT